jgi:hypothetical protein
MTEWNVKKTEESLAEMPVKKRGKFRRFLPFFVILAVVLGIVFAAAYRDGTGFDVLHRLFSYGSSEKKSGTTEYAYDSSSENRFAALGDSLVVLSNTELKVLDGNGKEVYSTPVKMSAPALSVGKDCAVAYDVGGTQLYVVNKDGKLLKLSADENEPFIAATLNHKDWLAVTAKKKNYKGCVTVYDEKGKKAFAFRSSKRFVTDAYVTDNCKRVASVTLGQNKSVFVSDVVLYNLSETKSFADYEIKDGMVLETTEMSSRLVTVSDTCLTSATERGRTVGTFDYSNEYLREYSLSGDGFAALLLNRYQSGSVGRLVTVNAGGRKIASLDVREEILSISAAGRYLAVLYADRLVIYNEDLKEYASLSNTNWLIVK